MTTDVGTALTGLTGTWGVFRGETRRWLGWRGVFHLILWLVVIEWILYISVVSAARPFGGLGFETLMNMLAVFPPIAGIVLTAAAVCGSYHDGTTAWVMGKPVPRAGHVVASVGGLWLGLAVTAIVVPGLVAYWWLPEVEPYRFVTPEAPPLGRFLFALGILCGLLAFFMALSAFLSILLRRRSVAVFIGAWALLMLSVPIPYSAWLDYTPARLLRTDLAPGRWAQLTEYIHGDAFDATTAVWGSLGLTAAFVAAAILVFHRLEL